MKSTLQSLQESISNAVDMIDHCQLVSDDLLLQQSTKYSTNSFDFTNANSLLDKCEQVTNSYKKTKPVIRVIHHLACSGGTQISKIISAMPNVYLLDDIHPFIKFRKHHSNSDVYGSALNAKVPSIMELGEELFVSSIRKVYELVKTIGSELVIKDNSFFDYLYNDSIHHKSIFNLLKEEFNIVSIVLYRDSIDSYASLANENFYGGIQFNFEEYCKRVKFFLQDYDSSQIFRYEDLNGAENKTTRLIMQSLDIEYNELYEFITTELSFHQFDKWQASDNDGYNTNLKTAPNLNEITKSETFFSLQKFTKPKKRELILIASMPRSGSTWVFNCVREIYKSQKLKFYSCWIEDYEPSNSSPIHIVKVHNPEHRLSSQADIIISTRRDIRNVCVSLIRMEWIANTDLDILNQCSFLVNSLQPFWNSKSKLEIEYEDILSKNEAVVKDVYNTLGIKTETKKIEKIAKYLETLSAPVLKYDRETQLHPNHRAVIKTHHQDIIPTNLARIINEKYLDWLEKYNYL
jgi:hypothetical protein